jgi:protein PhnA
MCACEYSYEMGDLLVCPECAHEWSPSIDADIDDQPEAERVVKDSVGNKLQDGDTVTIAKDLKVKGSSTAIKVGTKVRNIRLVSPVDGHDIDAKVDGFGQMMLKSSVVKKVL